MWLNHNWFKLSIVLILLLVVVLTAYYFISIQPRLELQTSELQHQNSNVATSSTISAAQALAQAPSSISKKVVAVSGSVSSKTPVEQSENVLSQDLLKKIMSRIVLVKCYGPAGSVQGSGTTQLISSPDPVVVTNFHVISLAGGISSTCTINIPNPPDYSPGDLFTAQIGLFDTHYPDVDAAVLHVTNVPSSDINIFQPLPLSYCDESKVLIGDKVTVFGYPAFGENIDTGAQSLTVTDGIVSGFIKTSYGLIYKTSAKFGHGVSGGLVVLNKNSCVLGIPTWGNNYGAEETLGQIQSWSSIKNSGGILNLSLSPSTQPSNTQISQPTTSTPSVSAPTTTQEDQTIAEDYYNTHGTCVGLSGNQYDDCVTYAFNH